jgi:hypothetical protein
MSAPTNPTWSSSSRAIAMEAPYAARSGTKYLRDKADFVRATIAILGFQVLIRVLILMRQLNY